MPTDYATKGATAMPVEDKFFALLERGLKCAPVWFRWRFYEWSNQAPILLQHIARICRAADLELDLWRARAYQREKFEKLIQAQALRRLSEDMDTVLGWYRADGYHIEPEAKKRVASAFLLAAAQDGELREEMTRLQRLPIGRKAIRLRIGALNDALAHYLPDIVRDEVLSTSASQTNAIHSEGHVHAEA